MCVSARAQVCVSESGEKGVYLPTSARSRLQWERGGERRAQRFFFFETLGMRFVATWRVVRCTGVPIYYTRSIIDSDGVFLPVWTNRCFVEFRLSMEINEVFRGWTRGISAFTIKQSACTQFFTLLYSFMEFDYGALRHPYTYVNVKRTILHNYISSFLVFKKHEKPSWYLLHTLSLVCLFDEVAGLLILLVSLSFLSPSGNCYLCYL